VQSESGQKKKVQQHDRRPKMSRKKRRRLGACAIWKRVREPAAESAQCTGIISQSFMGGAGPENCSGVAPLGL